MEEKLFTKLKWYPVKLLFIIEVFLFCMCHYGDEAVYATVFCVSFCFIIFWLLVYPFFMKMQTKKHLQEIRDSDMKYYDYFELGLRIKRIHTIAFVIMFPIAVFYAIFLFTIFVTLFIFVGYCVSYWWSSKIAKAGLDKAYDENLLDEKELKLYSLCQYICVLDWLSLKYLNRKL